MSILMVVLALNTLHFIADFVLQSDWMALNKSKHWDVLAIHCAVYTLCFLPFGTAFCLITLGSHFTVDWFTSRLTSRLWFMHLISQKDERSLWSLEKVNTRHQFFVAIGFDQLIHFWQLIITYAILYGIPILGS